MAPKKNTNSAPKQEEKNTAVTPPQKGKRKTEVAGTRMSATVTFKPAKGAVGSVPKRGKKEKFTDHTLFFYLLNRHEDATTVAVVIGGGGNVKGGSWLQKVIDDMVRKEGAVMAPIPYFEGTFYLCKEDGDRMLNDEG